MSYSASNAIQNSMDEVVKLVRGYLMVDLLEWEMVMENETERKQLTPEEIKRGLEKLIGALPEYDLADDLLTEAARQAVSPEVWLDTTPDGRFEIKRDIYRALKKLGEVELIDDKLTREDLDSLQQSIEHLATAALELQNGKISTGASVALIEITNAIIHIKTAMKK